MDSVIINCCMDHISYACCIEEHAWYAGWPHGAMLWANAGVPQALRRAQLRGETEAHGATHAAKPRKRPMPGLLGGRQSSLRRGVTSESLGPRHQREADAPASPDPAPAGGQVAAARRVALAGAHVGPEPRAAVRAGARNGRTSWPFGIPARTRVLGHAIAGRPVWGSTRAGLNPECGNSGRPLVGFEQSDGWRNHGALWPFGSKAHSRKPPEAPGAPKRAKNLHPPPSPSFLRRTRFRTLPSNCYTWCAQWI